ncbi:MAG TPA: phospholipase D-like domain-containing protein [Herbaspirillum sp.]|jgi:phospholipase D1/2
MAADIYTAQITKDTVTTVTGQYFDLEKPFAFPRSGNSCRAYTTGRDYFAAVAAAIRGAKSFIMITDWQLDYDVELDQRGASGHPGRLSELLAAAMQRGVHVRIILYDAINNALDTHEEQAQKYLGKLPSGKGSIAVMLQNPNTGRSNFGSYDLSKKSGSLVKDANSFFSHHQKSVVVDGRIAFLGGMDLAYGRWDTNAFDVVVDPALHMINDAYNQQLKPARALSAAEKKLTENINGRPGFHAPYDGDGKVLDAGFQPRQPWQDVALHVEGPSAFDVFVNFVLRWNSFAGSGTNYFDSGMNADWFKRAKGADYLIDPLKPANGSAVVQICRSASSAQLKDELVLWDDRHEYVNDDWKQSNPDRRKTVQKARAQWTGQHQTSIQDAMINCIRSAQGFIYIENQFFMSDCGPDQFGSPPPSNNRIIAELANAAGRAIYAGRPFHIWLVLPEHPEGMLEEDGTKSQAWWALQGVKRAHNSLIARIGGFIAAKNRKASQQAAMAGKKIGPKRPQQANESAEEWRKYLTVLNLRNYGHSDTHMVTEMIYIHSKLMIVDDAVAIIGSANINDRSLNGNGDTELAAVVVDSAEAKMTDVGAGIKIVTRGFARELRMRQWKKHLGMLVDQNTTGVLKEPAAPHGISIEHPLAPASINGIFKLAHDNRSAYSEVFLSTPRNDYKTLSAGRELAYPPVSGEAGQHDFSGVPKLQPAYMKTEDIKFGAGGAHAPHATGSMAPQKSIKIPVHDVAKAAAALHGKVKGFWVEMPLDWGVGELRTPKPPVASSMIAETERPSETTKGQGNEEYV